MRQLSSTFVLFFIVNCFWARRFGAVAGDNPWGADTLEWSLVSPPPDYNFVRIHQTLRLRLRWPLALGHALGSVRHRRDAWAVGVGELQTGIQFYRSPVRHWRRSLGHRHVTRRGRRHDFRIWRGSWRAGLDEGEVAGYGCETGTPTEAA